MIKVHNNYRIIVVFGCVMIDRIFFLSVGSYSSRNSSALVSAIILGVALTISLIGFATVTIILLMKTKIKVQTGAMTVTSESRKNENRSNISTNKNIAYVVHSPKQI